MQKDSKTLLSFLIIAAYFLMFLASAPPRRTTVKKEEPGMYSLGGWGGQSSYWDGTVNIANGLDVNGEVGHPLTVYAPTARCVSPTKAGWTYNYRILSGSLPPGLNWNYNYHGQITGIPKERGHWILKLEMYDIRCEGKTYRLQQEVRFHITGSGRVNN
jgi:hypothetical protein